MNIYKQKKKNLTYMLSKRHAYRINKFEIASICIFYKSKKKNEILDI